MPGGSPEKPSGDPGRHSWRRPVEDARPIRARRRGSRDPRGELPSGGTEHVVVGRRASPANLERDGDPCDARDGGKRDASRYCAKRSVAGFDRTLAMVPLIRAGEQCAQSLAVPARFEHASGARPHDGRSRYGSAVFTAHRNRRARGSPDRKEHRRDERREQGPEGTGAGSMSHEEAGAA